MQTVFDAKKDCYPENITVNGHICQVSLQSLCDHTVERICKYLNEVFDQLDCHEYENLKLYFKYGSDGSSSQSIYK